MSRPRTFARVLAPALVGATLVLGTALPAGAATPGGRLGTRLGGLGAGATTVTSSTGAPNGTTPGQLGAAACRPALLVRLRAIATAQLNGRVNRLQHLEKVATTARLLTSPDRAQLSTTLTGQLAGMQALLAKIPTDTTCAEVLADTSSMVTDYRVYVVTTPQVRLTVVADSEAALAAQLVAMEPHISAKIVRAQEAGIDVTAAQRAFTDLEAQVGAAQQQVTGISANVLSFTPASYPACWTAFEDARGHLQAGAAALRQAGADVRVIVKSTSKTRASTGAQPAPPSTAPTTTATT